jgi:hypothetical protein
VPVIVVSDSTEGDVLSRFAGKGHVGFVQKPYILAVQGAELRARPENPVRFS